MTFPTNIFTVQFFRLYFVRHKRFVFRFKIPKAVNFSLVRDFGMPQPGKLMQINALISAYGISALGRIREVLRFSCRSYVGAAIIQAVLISVVVNLGFWKPNSFSEFSVHQDLCVHFIDGLMPPSIPTSSDIHSLPIPLNQPVIINGVNDGVFALSERNSSSTFFHVSSLAGRFCFSDEPACLLKAEQLSVT